MLPLILFIFLLFSGCPDPSDNDSKEDDDDPVIVAPRWETYDGWRRFYTNDPDYCDYSFTSYYDLTDNKLPIVVETKKISGNKDYPYGVIFCRQPNGDMYRIWINTEGWYRISSCDYEGTDVEIEPWTFNSLINTGYGSSNTIEIDFSITIYNITINGGTPIISFNKAAGGAGGYLNLIGGKSGFYTSVGIEADEDFPNVVDIRFRMTAPITVP